MATARQVLVLYQRADNDTRQAIDGRIYRNARGGYARRADH